MSRPIIPASFPEDTAALNQTSGYEFALVATNRIGLRVVAGLGHTFDAACIRSPGNRLHHTYSDPRAYRREPHLWYALAAPPGVIAPPPPTAFGGKRQRGR